MTAEPGTYILILRNATTQRVQVGRWGGLDTLPGYYLYVGSAFGPGGVRARVARHCRSAKTRHWHVDYLRAVTTLDEVWYSHAAQRLEHDWAAALTGLRGAEAIAGFGCSDCGCNSHLFRFARPPALTAFARACGQHVSRQSCGGGH